MSTKRQKKEKKEKARQEAFSTSHVTEKSLGFIFILAFAFLLWGSWALPITDPVESNYALTAKEMVMSGKVTAIEESFILCAILLDMEIFKC